MKEDKKLKRHLVLQSFCPLFFLLIFKHLAAIDLEMIFVSFSHKDYIFIKNVLLDENMGNVLIILFCLLWLAISGVVALAFRNVNNSQFESHGESIAIITEKKDSGVMFLVTFLLPLLVEDI